MNISNLGERGIINNLLKKFGNQDFSYKLGDQQCEGIGDDCAVIGIDGSRSLVVTTDMLVEDVHFLRGAIAAKDLGWKSLAVNISDVAAMGARPFASFMSISLPKDLETSWVDEFIEGYHELSALHGVMLLGGDTVGGEKIAINIVAMGEVDNQNIKRRTEAKLGDMIFVTGNIGESAAGLKILLDRTIKEYDTEQQRLIDLHHRPTAQVSEGQWLGAQSSVNAMIDLSDGLLNDIKHITKRFGAEIDSSKIPTSVDIATAIGGGEDYQLLFTVSAKEAEGLSKDYEAHFNKPIYNIGVITEGRSVVWQGLDSQTLDKLKTFSHF